jgi:hypothetical protein
MRNTAIKASLSALLVLAAVNAVRSEDEKDLTFSGQAYPIEIKLSAAQPAGAVLFESAFSEVPPADYDTVLLQGEMPQAEVRLDIVAKSKAPAGADARYQQATFHRFPTGRFWAKYRLGTAGRMPLKLSVVNLGLKQDSTLVIYGSDLVKEAAIKEGVQASTFTYVPDPSMSVSTAAPFHVIRRAEWNAAPPKEAYTLHSPVYFTIHHTQSHYPKTYAESVAEMQFIQDFHQNGRGWIDIAYHFLIDPMGNIFEGRPLRALGAHVKGHNTGNVGISIMGNYHPPQHDPVTQATINSFVSVGRYLKDTYDVNVSSFYAHRELGQTDCPGDDLYAQKPMLRDLIFTPQPAAPNPADPQQLTPGQKCALETIIKSFR